MGSYGLPGLTEASDPDLKVSPVPVFQQVSRQPMKDQLYNFWKEQEMSVKQECPFFVIQIF